MAEEKTVKEATQPVSAGSPVEAHEVHNRHGYHGAMKVVILVAVGAALLLSLLAFCFSMVALKSQRYSRFDNDDRFSSIRDRAKLRGGMMNDGSGPGLSMSRNSSTHIGGVVSAVNGDSLTVIGSGTTKTVKTNGDTLYNGAKDGKKPAVNETVSISGTTSGDTFTAKSVRILN